MLHVLHIEDDAEMLVMVRAALSVPDVEISSVDSLKAAKIMLDKLPNRYDLLLVDLGLPDSNGVNTVRALAGYNLPIVVLTGVACPKVLSEAAEAGAEDYLVKTSITPERLVSRIRFVYQRFVSQSATPRAKKKRMKAETFEAVKPFISCAAL